MSKAVAIAATASAARRVRWVMIGMLMTLLAALSLSAWSQPAASQPGMGGSPEAASPQRQADALRDSSRSCHIIAPCEPGLCRHA